jgi:nitronate monooxygenase
VLGRPCAFAHSERSGVVLIQTLMTPEVARRAVDLGADLVVAQSVESGGYAWSTLGTIILLPLVCDAMTGGPVFAALGAGPDAGCYPGNQSICALDW